LHFCRHLSDVTEVHCSVVAEVIRGQVAEIMKTRMYIAGTI